MALGSLATSVWRLYFCFRLALTCLECPGHLSLFRLALPSSASGTSGCNGIMLIIRDSQNVHIAGSSIPWLQRESRHSQLGLRMT
jgi:hypothetical protein